MRPHPRAPYRQLTTATTLLTSTILILIGSSILYLGGRQTAWWEVRPGLAALTINLGALIIASTALMTLWELAGKRAFTREVFEMARTSTDIEAAGITRIGTDYVKEPDWKSLFAGVRELDIFLVYGSTWRNTHMADLQNIVKRGGRIRIYLPDPAKIEVISQLAERFAKTSESLGMLIDEARIAYQSLPSSRGGSVEVRYCPGAPVFSCYRFDGVAVMTLYTHQRRRTGVPTLVCREGGSFYHFIRDEFEALSEQSREAPVGISLTSAKDGEVTSSVGQGKIFDSQR